jgi:hypothetical protein
MHLLDDEKGLHLYPLLVFLLRELGPGYLDWDSIALRLELEERWGAPGNLTWERIQAGRIMAGHDGFWTHMEVFENCALALAGEIPVFSFFQPLEAESIAVVLDTAARIKKQEFSEEVKGYMLACCLEDATWYFEAPLDILKPYQSWYDKDRKISRPHGLVKGRIDKPRSGPPKDALDVQVDNVLSVRRTLAGYTSLIESQIKELLG